MPLFFFVTGALNRNRSIDGPLRFILRRTERIIIPYWFYALLIICVIIIRSIISSEGAYMFPVKETLLWIFPGFHWYSPFPCSASAVWFVPVYIACVILLPAALAVYRRKLGLILFPVLIGLLLLFRFLNVDFLERVFFYMIWICAGFYYDRLRALFTSRSAAWLIVTACCCVTVVALYLLGFSVDMQTNKFPPNLIFLIFCTGAVSVVLKLILCGSRIIEKLHSFRPLHLMLNEYETHSLSIFLFQPVVFYPLMLLFGKLRSHIGGSDYLYFVFYVITAFPLCAVIGKIFSFTESIRFGKTQKDKKQQPQS